eukprot:c51748_g1_i1 orf=2-289(+)
MYGKCGSVDDARSVFDGMSQHNVVSWNSMIASYSRNGHGKEALELFRQMQLKFVVPDKISFISFLDACAGEAAIADGKDCHASIMDSEFEMDVVV